MNNEQFTHMVQQYERLVYTICYQFTKDHQLAEDLAQETFLATDFACWIGVPEETAGEND